MGHIIIETKKDRILDTLFHDCKVRADYYHHGMELWVSFSVTMFGVYFCCLPIATIKLEVFGKNFVELKFNT